MSPSPPLQCSPTPNPGACSSLLSPQEAVSRQWQQRKASCLEGVCPSTLNNPGNMLWGQRKACPVCPPFRAWCEPGLLSHRWTRREEADFYRVVSTFGVVFDPVKQQFDWNQFRAFARLDKKSDESLEKYFSCFVAMCRRVCRMPAKPEDGRYMNDEPHCALGSQGNASRFGWARGPPR